VFILFLRVPTCPSFNWFKESELFSFTHPPHPENRYGIDDEVYSADAHWLAPGVTGRAVASSPQTQNRSFPIEKHFVLPPTLYSLYQLSPCAIQTHSLHTSIHQALVPHCYLVTYSHNANVDSLRLVPAPSSLWTLSAPRGSPSDSKVVRCKDSDRA